ncbi:MAG: hypothetical protein ACWGMZ_08815 [Thermoguttaceae bacterium]
MSVQHALIPQRMMFRFSLPCLFRESIWSAKGAGLEERFALPSLGELEGRKEFAQVRAAWNQTGLAFSVRVQGKSQAIWRRESKPEDSDGVQIWIDTRDVHNVHRAGRFCHRFLFLPIGAGSRANEPTAFFPAINRAKEHPRPIPRETLKVVGKKQTGGYVLDAFISGEALTGFDPQEHPRVGFTYAVVDRELGEQTLCVGSPMPYQEDPSLWATLELVRALPLPAMAPDDSDPKAG